MEDKNHLFASLRGKLAQTSSKGALCDLAASALVSEVGFDFIAIHLPDSVHIKSSLHPDKPLPFQVDDHSAKLFGYEFTQPIFVADPERSYLPTPVIEALLDQGVRSVALLPLVRDSQVNAILECRFSRTFHRFRPDERLFIEFIVELLRLHLERLSSLEVAPDPPLQMAQEGSAEKTKLVYQHVARHAGLIIAEMDAQLRVTQIIGDCDRLLGVSSDKVVKTPTLWQELLDSKDLRRIMKQLRVTEDREVTGEVRVHHLVNRYRKRFLVRAVRRIAASGEGIGWEVFAIDVTAQYEAEERLRSQSRRIEALYEVARSLELNVDPSLVALKGLRAVIRATGSACGFGCLLDSHSGKLEIVASEGLSPRYIEDLSKILSDRTLAKLAVDRREGVLIEDIQHDSRAAVDLARLEGLHSTIIMPLLFEKMVLGVIVIFRKDYLRFSQDDFELVSAACSQIALAARQAELYAAEKRQASSYSALYRLSHELSKQMTLKEVAEQAFPVIQEEIACKRMWLGVMNNRGSHIQGQAGVGPGIRRHLIDIQIELNQRHDFLDEAIKKKIPVVIEAGQEVECSELGRVLTRLNCGTLVVVPLISLGQVVGVLVVEPTAPSAFFVQRKLALLNSMATEIATVIMARKFEARMADADKMRMAGLLASGVAHNFNNLLQAVMGQASLIELQASEDPRIVSSAKMISEAASRGAGLVKQLFSFSMQGMFQPRPSAVGRVILDAQELYRSILGSSIQFDVSLEEELPDVVVDNSQFQQVITNLLINAREAMGEKPQGTVRVSARKVRLRSGEIDPELAPGVYLRIDVEDNGAGMTSESQARCFEPFFTTKNTDTRTGLGFGGSGLGLSSAYSIMKQHDGLITVRSQLGEGTTFSLYLPAVTVRESEVSKEAAEPLATPVAKNFRVFLFELDSSLSFSLRSTIEAPGLVVAIPLSRERLYQSVKESQEGQLCVILDLDKVGEKAAEVCKELSQIRPTAALIGLAADPEKFTDLLKALSPQLQLIEKPARIWTLSEKIRALHRTSGEPLEAQVEKEVVRAREAASSQDQSERSSSKARTLPLSKIKETF